MSKHTFPLEVVVDVTREDLLDRFAALTAEGETWAFQQTAQAVLELLGELAKRADFVDNADALQLCAELIAGDVWVTFQVAQILETVAWPTVQAARSRSAAR